SRCELTAARSEMIEPTGRPPGCPRAMGVAGSWLRCCTVVLHGGPLTLKCQRWATWCSVQTRGGALASSDGVAAAWKTEGRQFDPAPGHQSPSNMWACDQAKRSLPLVLLTAPRTLLPRPRPRLLSAGVRGVHDV